MTRNRTWTVAAVLATSLILAGWAASATAQSADPQSPPKTTAEQEKQLDQLKQIEGQLLKDRNALHAAISDFGWDSDEADQAREQLFRTRSEYRKLRRQLRQAGVRVPPPTGLGRSGYGLGFAPDYGAGPKRGWGRRGGWGRAHRGCAYHCWGGCACPRCGW